MTAKARNNAPKKSTNKTASSNNRAAGKRTVGSNSKAKTASKKLQPESVTRSTKTDVVRARIDGQIKREAALVLAAMGLTVSDAYRMMMVRIAREKALPFNPLIPNNETIEALEAVRRGEVTKISSISEMFE